MQAYIHLGQNEPRKNNFTTPSADCFTVDSSKHTYKKRVSKIQKSFKEPKKSFKDTPHVASVPLLPLLLHRAVGLSPHVDQEHGGDDEQGHQALLGHVHLTAGQSDPASLSLSVGSRFLSHFSVSSPAIYRVTDFFLCRNCHASQRCHRFIRPFFWSMSPKKSSNKHLHFIIGNKVLYNTSPQKSCHQSVVYFTEFYSGFIKNTSTV